MGRGRAAVSRSAAGGLRALRGHLDGPREAAHSAGALPRRAVGGVGGRWHPRPLDRDRGRHRESGSAARVATQRVVWTSAGRGGAGGSKRAAGRRSVLGRRAVWTSAGRGDVLGRAVWTSAGRGGAGGSGGASAAPQPQSLAARSVRSARFRWALRPRRRRRGPGNFATRTIVRPWRR